MVQNVSLNHSLTAQKGLRSLHLLYGRERSTLTAGTTQRMSAVKQPLRRTLRQWQEDITQQAEEDNIRGEYMSKESRQLLHDFLRDNSDHPSRSSEEPSVEIDCTLTVWHDRRPLRNNRTAARQISRVNSFRKTYNKAWSVTNYRGRHGSAMQIRSTIDIEA